SLQTESYVLNFFFSGKGSEATCSSQTKMYTTHYYICFTLNIYLGLWLYNQKYLNNKRYSDIVLTFTFIQARGLVTFISLVLGSILDLVGKCLVKCLGKEIQIFALF
ncbi:hypothetical protein ACJX0J_009710, partial [Zea mays]